jgi:actinin alpha
MPEGAVMLKTASMRGVRDLTARVSQAREQMGDEELIQAASQVQAKLKMFSAYEEELTGRAGGVGVLEKLIAQLLDAGCPPFRTFALTTRMDAAKESIDSLTSAGLAYKGRLEAELERLNKQDDMRLAFAKRADALNRQLEEKIDELTEVLVVDSIAEAEQQLTELANGQGALKALEAELDSLAEYANEMSRAKIFTNPYSRFEMSSLLEAMDLCQEAYDGRDEQLKGALADQQKIDEAKRSFAAAAEVVVAFCKEEKGSMEAEAPAIQITPDDGAAIVKGKEMLATLEGYTSGAARDKRAAQLAPAQEQWDFLMNASEMDNKYTEYTMPQLKSAMEQLEQLIRDKMTFVEAQLARAQADITPEQHAELKASFEHFDKDKSGMLNKDEFTAAIRSLDFELTEAEEAATFEKFAEEQKVGDETLHLIAFQGFTTFVLQQYKDNDTQEALVGAFNAVAGGKDVVLAAELNACMKPPDAAFLLDRLEVKDDFGLDYKTFAAGVYGATP